MTTPKAPVAISWDQARKLVLLGSVRTILRTKGLQLRLVSRSGNVFVTAEPTEGDARRLADVVDPCHVFIETWEKRVQRVDH